MALTVDTLRDGLRGATDAAIAAADDLNEADARLGDGDLGVSLRRAATDVRAALDDLPADDLGQALLAVAQTLTRSHASSFVTLAATGVMSAAKAAKGRAEVPWSEVADLLEAALEKMKARGKVELGQKTVLDSLAAAAAAARGLDTGAELRAAVQQASLQALDDFRERPAGAGRARIFAERSLGLDDPGMLAFRKLVAGLGSGQ